MVVIVSSENAKAVYMSGDSPCQSRRARVLSKKLHAENNAEVQHALGSHLWRNAALGFLPVQGCVDERKEHLINDIWKVRM